VEFDAAAVGGARRRPTIPSVVLLFVGMAGATCALTVLFLSMRAVMRIGGFCASGGPYVIQTTCPKGVPGLLIGSIWLGIAFLGLYLWGTIKVGGPNLAGLAWPALFLSLGFNFFDFGLRPPEGQGLVWGWVICGIVFVLMGGVPLVIVLATLGRSHASPSRAVRVSAKLLAGSRSPAGDAAPPWSWVSSGQVSSPAADEPPPMRGEDVVSELERLADLRRRGDVTDQEYDAAKRRLLGTGGEGS
jgi:hypothetical protein